MLFFMFQKVAKDGLKIMDLKNNLSHDIVSLGIQVYFNRIKLDGSDLIIIKAKICVFLCCTQTVFGDFLVK